MATIVEYTLSKPLLNAYPRRIVSPPSPSSCCTGAMVLIGKRETDGPWRYQYKRCRVCGYTVRVFPGINPWAGLQELLGDDPREGVTGQQAA